MICLAEARIAPLEQRIEIESVFRDISGLCCGRGLLAFVGRIAGGELQTGPDPAAGGGSTERRDGSTMGQVELVNHRTSRLRVRQAGRHAAMHVALLGYDLRLVDGQPTVNPITNAA